MKCSSCGGEYELTDERCPFCGRLLTETAIHRAQKADYEERSEQTKNEINKVHSGNIPLVISAVVMVLLIVGICVSLYVKDNAYIFRDSAKRKESVEKYDEYYPQIKDFLDAGDYTGFTAFMEYHYIASYEEPYKDLDLLYELAKEYSSLVSSVENVSLHGEEARWYRPQSDISSCSSAIYQFYHEFEYNRDDIDADSYKEYMYDMKDKADIILKIYLGFDDAKREKFLAGSTNEQDAYVEEVILGE